MQKFNSTGSHGSALADGAGAGDGRENGAGKHFLARPEEESSFCTKRKMLVGLDVICLCVGKKKSLLVFTCFK